MNVYIHRHKTPKDTYSIQRVKEETEALIRRHYKNLYVVPTNITHELYDGIEYKQPMLIIMNQTAKYNGMLIYFENRNCKAKYNYSKYKQIRKAKKFGLKIVVSNNVEHIFCEISKYEAELHPDILESEDEIISYTISYDSE